MNIEQTKEGLDRLTVKIPESNRNIYFYTISGTTQQINPSNDNADDPLISSSDHSKHLEEKDV
jgi:hypothetical protein